MFVPPKKKKRKKKNTQTHNRKLLAGRYSDRIKADYVWFLHSLDVIDCFRLHRDVNRQQKKSTKHLHIYNIQCPSPNHPLSSSTLTSLLSPLEIK